MDVVRTQQGDERALLTMTRYLQLPADERPTQLWCAGTADQGSCRGQAFPKSLAGTAISPHFASLHHAPGCDHAAPSPSTALSRQTRPTPDSAVLHLIAASPPQAHFPVPALPPNRRNRTGPRAGLRTALRALTSAGLPDELLVQWRQQPPRLAYEFFIHLNSASIVRDEPRGYWGRVATVTRHKQTGSTHLSPRTGARIVVDTATTAALELRSPDLFAVVPDSTVLAVGPLRRARSGRLYVLITQPGLIAWL